MVDLIQNVSVVEAERRRERDIGREKTTDIKHLKLHRTLTPSLRLFSVLVLLFFGVSRFNLSLMCSSWAYFI